MHIIHLSKSFAVFEAHKLTHVVPRWSAKIKGILTATRTHAINLCKFVTIYKLLLILQKKLNGGKERDLDTFVAGGLGGWWVFGERTPVSLNLDVEKKSWQHIPADNVSPYLDQNSDQRANGPLRPIPFSPFSPSSTLQHCITTQNTYRTPRSPSPITHFSPGEPKAHPTSPITLCRSRRIELGVGDVHVQT